MLSVLLVVAGMVSATQASNAPTVDFGFGLQHDMGSSSSIGINNGGRILEVHQSQSGTALWWKVGTTFRSGINWSAAARQYDSGKTPRCALNNNNVAIEVHHTSGTDNSLWYHVGRVDPASATWAAAVQYDTGAVPAVGLNDAGTVVEVHQSQSGNGLWYHVGTVSGNMINWGLSLSYDSGTAPSVAINNSATVVEVHQAQTGSGLWYHVGTISGNTINWGPSINYDSGTGPSVAVTDSGVVIETHASGSGSLWQHTGVISGTTIHWIGTSSFYDNANSVTTASNGALAVAASVKSGNTLNASASLVMDRSSWMENALGTIGNTTLRQMAFPGSHDAGMYNNSFPASLAQTQDMTINQQLYAGIRYFDLRPHWTGSDLQIYHGPIDVESVQTVLSDVQSFMNTNRKELVILKFSHYDNFDSAGVAYQTLVSWIHNALDPWLYTSAPSGTRLADTAMNSFIGSQGRVVVVNDGSQPLSHPSPGIWVYRDWSSADPQNGDLRVFDQYANVTDYPTMMNDQFNKFQSYNGTCQNNASVPCDLFLLSWTLTPAVNVWSVVGPPDRGLGYDVNDLVTPNSHGQILNIIYTDYNEYSRSTDLSVFLNGIKNSGGLLGTHRLLNVSTGLALDGGSNAQGTLVQMYSSNGTADQLWNIQTSGSGYSITSVQSGLALDGGSNTLGTHPQLWPANGTADQQWKIQSSGSGYNIISVQSGLAVDAAGAAQGSNPQMASGSGAASGQWKLQ
jgi:hypothetical protein